MTRIRVVQMGLGPVGVAMARVVEESPRMDLVGALDPRPDLPGTVVSGVPVEADAPALLDRVRPDVVLHATGSFLQDVAGQLREILERGISVVSTCEELAYPFRRHPDLARELDQTARRHGAVLLGSGVNPGFVMDKLVVTLLGACVSPGRVRVSRVVDASRRREPLQRKIGAGITVEEFETRKRTGRFGHIGLVESAHMVADVMGVPDDRVVGEELRPRVADRPVTTPFFSVSAGQVAGIDHRVTVREGQRERVRLELAMYVGADAPADRIEIDGRPPIDMTLTGGIEGEQGTIAVVVNAAHLVGSLPAGLRTMLDLPLR